MVPRAELPERIDGGLTHAKSGAIAGCGPLDRDFAPGDVRRIGRSSCPLSLWNVASNFSHRSRRMDTRPNLEGGACVPGIETNYFEPEIAEFIHDPWRHISGLDSYADINFRMPADQNVGLF